MTPSMLTPYVKPQFVERVFTDEAGRKFKLVFFVALINGEVKGRLVSATPIAQAVENDVVAFLPAHVSDKNVETVFISDIAPSVSPYFSLEYLLSSQPTRAPSFS